MSVNALAYEMPGASAEYPILKFPLAPPFVHKIGALAAENGFSQAVTETFSDAGISFEFEGDLAAAQGGGLIVASDHRQRLEPLLVQAAMGASGHDASHVLAMPTSFAGRLMQTSGPIGENLVIPVVPGVVDKVSITQPREKYRQLRHPEMYQIPKEERKQMNAAAVMTAAHQASAGEAVTICPTGDIVESAHAPWQKGLGRIIQEVDADRRDETQLAVLRPDDFSIGKVMSSLLLRDMGIRPRPQTIVFRAALLGSAEELLTRTDNGVEHESAQQISDAAKDFYCEQFQDVI